MTKEERAIELLKDLAGFNSLDQSVKFILDYADEIWRECAEKAVEAVFTDIYGDPAENLRDAIMRKEAEE
jgi:hypothetical protein